MREHRDEWVNDWLGGVQRLVRRETDPEVVMPQGSYRESSPVPHSDDDCPFRDRDVLPMRQVFP